MESPVPIVVLLPTSALQDDRVRNELSLAGLSETTYKVFSDSESAMRAIAPHQFQLLVVVDPHQEREKAEKFVQMMRWRNLELVAASLSANDWKTDKTFHFPIQMQREVEGENQGFPLVETMRSFLSLRKLSVQTL